MGGNNAADFSDAPSNCSGATLAAAASCNISVAFAPLAAGQRTETITLSDDSASSPQIITVLGNANPAFAVGATSTTATITAGGTAQYQLQLTPGSNFTGSITMVCSGAPLGATCQIPATVQIASGAVAPFTVSVVTSGATASVTPYTAPRGPTSPWAYPEISIRIVLGLLLVALLFLTSEIAIPQARKKVRFTTALCTGLLLTTLTGFFAGCGGGASQAAVVAPQPRRASSRRQAPASSPSRPQQRMPLAHRSSCSLSS